MLLNSPRLNDAMTTYELAAIVAVAPENVLYTSGFWCLSQWIRRGPQAFVVVPASSQGEPVVITSTSTLDLVADQGVTARVRRYGGFIVDTDRSIVLDSVSTRQAELYGLLADDSAVSGLVAEIRAAGLANSRIGIDEVGLLPGDIEALKSALPEVTWVNASSVFRWVRAVKTSAEIARLKAIGEITERSISAALAIAKEGVTEFEMARVFHSHTVGEDAFPVLGCIGFGERSALPNVQPSDRALRKGDVIRFDVGGHFRNYRADIARNAYFGKPSRDIEIKYNALNEGVKRGIEHVRPGVSASEIFRVVVEAVREAGIPHYQRSHVGHGIGLDGYDFPLLSASSEDVLEDGMVLCVETPYYELGRVGLQVEDMVVVRPDGAEMLTNNGDSLVVIGQ